jgi:hypothetical protein
MWITILLIYYFSGEVAEPDMGEFTDCESAKKYYESVYYLDRGIKSIECKRTYVNVKKRKL